MRLAILTSLVLLPVLAHGQAVTPVAAKPATTSAVLHAELNQPVGMAAAVKAVAAADTTATNSSLNAASPAVREIVQTLVTENFTHQALRQAGIVEYGFTGGELNDESAPRMTRPVEVQLTQEELAATPDLTQVAVSGTVDAYGFPRDLTVTRSAGKAVDQKALAAVSATRFKPATVNNQPVDSAVTISIKIEKQ
jgi:TonB family protein